MQISGIADNLYKVIITNDAYQDVLNIHKEIYGDTLNEEKSRCFILSEKNIVDNFLKIVLDSFTPFNPFNKDYKNFIYCDNIEDFPKIIETIEKLSNEIYDINYPSHLKQYDHIIDIIKYFITKSDKKTLQITDASLENLRLYHNDENYRTCLYKNSYICCYENDKNIEEEFEINNENIQNISIVNNRIYLENIEDKYISDDNINSWIIDNICAFENISAFDNINAMENISYFTSICGNGNQYMPLENFAGKISKIILIENKILNGHKSQWKKVIYDQDTIKLIKECKYLDEIEIISEHNVYQINQIKTVLDIKIGGCTMYLSGDFLDTSINQIKSFFSLL